MAEVTTYLHDLVDTAELEELIEAGYVRRQVHPSGELAILNYTERCQFERVWNDVTRQCRGLVVRAATGAVVARPWRKFFNYGEHSAAALDLDAPAVVTDKIDGSLGILYPAPEGGHAIATRGSFTSEQALHATRLWNAKYAASTEVGDGVTWLFEIVYPGNRIVCDYGGTDDLVLLGGVEVATGRPIPPGGFGWDGPVTTTFAFATLGEALAAPPRTGAEGYVIGFPGHDLMIKVKQDDYVALHRIVTGLNARVVWDRLATGETVADICQPLPDEFHDWVRRVAGELVEQRDAVLRAARAEHDRIVATLPTRWTRKDYALAAARSDQRAWLFMILDGRDPAPKVWRSLRPAGDSRPVNTGEDVA